MTKAENLLHKAAEYRAINLNIFIISKEWEAIPHKNPYAEKVLYENAINNLQYTCSGAILFNTQDKKCTIEICTLTNYLGVQVQSRILYENITDQFLL